MVDDGSAHADIVDHPEEDTYESGSFDSPRRAPFIDFDEIRRWTFYRAVGVEFVATLLFLYITISTIIGNKAVGGSDADPSRGGVGTEGIAWAFGGTIFVLVYCTAGVSGGHINPAVTFGLFVARKLSIPCAILYMTAQCLGAICGTGLVKARQKSLFDSNGGGANLVSHGYTKGDGLLAEIIGTFLLVYCVMSATDPKKKARESHIPVLAPLPIGFAIFIVHLATIPITGTGINPARSFGPAVIYNNSQVWNDHWIFWVGPLIGAGGAALYHNATTYFHPKKIVTAATGTDFYRNNGS